MEKIEAVFIGTVTQDQFFTIQEEPRSDRRIRASHTCVSMGGVAATAALAFGKLGGRAGLIAPVGSDDMGIHLKNLLASQPLSYCELIQAQHGSTPFSTILVEPNGKRMICYYGGCMQDFHPEQLPSHILKQADILHFAGVEPGFVESVLFWCKNNTHALLSVDGGNYSREAAEMMLPYLDIFIPDDKTVENTLGIPPSEACRYYYEKGVHYPCVTLGEKGSVAYVDKTEYFAPSYPANVIDTTGAGDNFHGAFLYGLHRGFSIENLLRFSNAFASLCCEGLGGSTSTPNYHETIQKMNTRR